MIRTIETNWHGCRFRSRLEARWAAIFEAMGISWEYEPEGYKLNNLSRYLPDFVLHGVGGRVGSKGDGDLFVEVKGMPDKLDGKTLWKLDDFSKQNDLLVVGPVPDMFEVNSNGKLRDVLSIVWDAYNDSNGRAFSCRYLDGDEFPAFLCLDSCGNPMIEDGNENEGCLDDSLTRSAYAVGRAARFEYGESPDEDANYVRDIVLSRREERP